MATIPRDGSETTPRRALVLGGGGARGGYQAGATLALLEIAGEGGLQRPFSILSGLSAGAINVAYLASHPERPLQAARDLAGMWSRLRSEQVFRADAASFARIGFGWFVDLVFGGMKSAVDVKALLDTAPLLKLLRSVVPVDRLRAGVADGMLESVLLTAVNYATLQSVSFAQTSLTEPDEAGHGGLRTVRATDLTRHHVLASAAIPLFFPPVSIDGQFYGDGAVKNTAPLSGVTRVGATSVCVIGVHRPSTAAPPEPANAMRPTAARLLGTLMDTLFMDYLDTDVERLEHINRVIEEAPQSRRAGAAHRQRVIPPLYLLPSEDVGQLALRFIDSAPATVRYLIRGLGSESESAALLSYLLFSGPYGTALVDLGYRDTWDRKEQVRAFLSS